VFTSEFPKNAFRPIRIAYYTAVLGNKEAIENALAIDASPATDLLTISNNDIDEGILDHSDVLVLSDGDMDLYVERLKPPHLAVINRFVDRGGFVIASEQTKSLVPGTSDRVFLLADEQTIPAMAHQISSSLSS
jgi:hypothetical protein